MNRQPGSGDSDMPRSLQPLPLQQNEPSRLPASASLAKRWMLVLAAASVTPWIVGCDSEAGRADRQIEKDIVDGRAALDEGTPDSASKAQALFDSAAKNKDASPQFRAYAKGILGQLELDAARADIATI